MSGVVTATQFEQLVAEVQELRARQDILDCINRYAQGVDRHDTEIIVSAYHEDGVDQHGALVLGMPEFADAVNAGHASWTRLHTHNNTTHNCVVDGDRARAETYVLAGLAAADKTHVRLCGARYLDRLERRDGVWGIVERRVIIDWVFTGDASVFHTPAFAERGFPEGTWDRSDPLYELLPRP